MAEIISWYFVDFGSTATRLLPTFWYSVTTETILHPFQPNFLNDKDQSLIVCCTSGAKSAVYDFLVSLKDENKSPAMLRIAAGRQQHLLLIDFSLRFNKNEIGNRVLTPEHA